MQPRLTLRSTGSATAFVARASFHCGPVAARCRTPVSFTLGVAIRTPRMRRVVISGGPGAGKTTLLAEIARQGFSVVAESAREVIAERVASGLSPRPEAEAFAREILRRDIAKYKQSEFRSETVFFDRSAIEALGMVHALTPMSETNLFEQLDALRFFKTVFVLPPWRAIYCTDSERDHSFAHAERVHAEVLGWYRRCGYEVDEVPCVSVEARAQHVLRHLAAAGDA